MTRQALLGAGMFTLLAGSIVLLSAAIMGSLWPGLVLVAFMAVVTLLNYRTFKR